MEAIFARIDAISASLGLLRESARVKKGINPWGYTNGAKEEKREFEMLEKAERGGSFESDTTLGEKERRGEF